MNIVRLGSKRRHSNALGHDSVGEVTMNTRHFRFNRHCFLAIALLMLATAVRTSTFAMDKHMTRRESLDCLTKGDIAIIKKQPESIVRLFHKCRSELVMDLGDKFLLLSDSELFAAFSSLVSYEMAPYGNSVATDLAILAKEPKLDCDNYAILVGHFCKMDSSRLNTDLQLHFVGWDGGEIGFHKPTNWTLLLDDS